MNDLGLFLQRIRQKWVCLLTNMIPFFFNHLGVCVSKINYDHFGKKIQSMKQLLLMPKFLGVFLAVGSSGERLPFDNLCKLFPDSVIFYYTISFLSAASVSIQSLFNYMSWIISCDRNSDGFVFKFVKIL